MLFRMLAGKHPLDPLRGPQLAGHGACSTSRCRACATWRRTCPQELADVVDRCLLKHKEQRFPDALALLRALEPFLPGRYTRELRIDESPYAGLSSFQEADADRFFGRSREIAALVNRIRDRPLMAVVGPSGAGKSSFVRAGLVPALKRSGEAWEALVIRPGRDPLAALASIVAPLVSSVHLARRMTSQEQSELVERLRAEPGYVGAVLRSRARRERRKILLFVDQFEELYTLVPDASERLAFTACLSGIADDATSPIRVVLSIRSDFLDRVPEDERFMAELSQGLFFLTAPSREGLRDALVQPAEMAGYRFETPAMVEGMLQHLEATQGALPLLAVRRHPALGAARSRAQAAHRAELRGHGRHRRRAGQPRRQRAGASCRPRRARWRARSSCGWSRPSARAPSSPWRSCASCRGTPAELQRLIDQLVQARLLVVQTGGRRHGSHGGDRPRVAHPQLAHAAAAGWTRARRTRPSWSSCAARPGSGRPRAATATCCGAARWWRRRSASSAATAASCPRCSRTSWRRSSRRRRGPRGAGGRWWWAHGVPGCCWWPPRRWRW